jgi:hypothetical protein
MTPQFDDSSVLSRRFDYTVARTAGTPDVSATPLARYIQPWCPTITRELSCNPRITEYVKNEI